MEILKQGKTVCKPTAFRCYHCFSLRLLLFLASRAKWLQEKKSYSALLLLSCFSLWKAVKMKNLEFSRVTIPGDAVGMTIETPLGFSITSGPPP